MTYLFTAIWPVTDPGATEAELVEQAAPELLDLVHGEGVILTADPRWTLHHDRLVVVCPARAKAPWDESDREDAAKAYLFDIMPIDLEAA